MNRHLNRFANLVILELSMLSLCSLIRDSFALVLPPETFLWLALLCLLLWIAESFRFGALIGLPFSAAVLWYLYQNRSVDLGSRVSGGAYRKPHGGAAVRILYTGSLRLYRPLLR